MYTLLIAHAAALVGLLSAMQDDSGKSNVMAPQKVSTINDLWTGLKPAPRADYGRTPQDPINVGGTFRTGVENQIRYLRTLRGPNGEPCTFDRLGSCCPFVSPVPFTDVIVRIVDSLGNERDSVLVKHDGMGYIDIYEITYKGLESPIKLYLNFYYTGNVYLPRGFTAKKQR